jgi:uncharacterized membrane protein
MKKPEFTAALRKRLSGLPKKELEESISFYHEMIDDRIEEGMGEQEAIADIGGVDKVASEIVESITLSRLVKERIKPNRALKVWEIVLILLGSPIWLAIAVSLAAAFFAIFASLWAGIVSVWAAELSVAVCGLAGVLFSFFLVGTGTTYQGLLLLGGGLFCAGLSYFGFILCKCLTVLLGKLCKLFVLFVKSLFVEKEGK